MEREEQRARIKKQVLAKSGVARKAARLRKKTQTRIRQTTRNSLLQKYLGKKVSFRIGKEEHTAEDVSQSKHPKYVAFGH